MTPRRSSSRVAGTTILTGVSFGDDKEDDVLIVDTSDDLRYVIVTSPYHREEGSPESAMAFAGKLREKHGDAVSEFCLALERAARKCLTESKTPRPS